MVREQSGQRAAALARTPTLRTREGTGFLNEAAVEKLGGGWACLCKGADGSFYFEPLHVPAEAVAISRIYRSKKEQGNMARIRVAVGTTLPSGKYELDYDEDEGVLVVRPA